jgi:hypothetical protein
MLMLDQWEQTAVFNPGDPTQKKIEQYTGIPGGYSSFYFNRRPVQGQLDGPFTSGIATGAGVTIGVLFGTLMIGVGAWGLRKAGILKKKPAGVSGLGFFRFKRRRKRR